MSWRNPNGSGPQKRSENGARERVAMNMARVRWCGDSYANKPIFIRELARTRPFGVAVVMLAGI
jgi:hypothetical protein